MPITPNQITRLYGISDDVRRAPNHPSRAIRDSVADYSPFDIEATVVHVERVVEHGGFREASAIIAAYRSEGEAGVIRHALHNPMSV